MFASRGLDLVLGWGWGREQRSVSRRWGATLGFVLVLFASLVAPAEPGADRRGEMGPSPTAGESGPKAELDSLEELAPVLMQIINFSALDPGLAAGMVPEPWVEAAVDGALRVASESAKLGNGLPAAEPYPIGPWQSSAALATSIQSVQTGAVVGLYRALRPRLEAECRRREVDATGCERAIKVTASRLSAASVSARAAAGRQDAAEANARTPLTPLTPTQAAVAGLGEPAAKALRTGIRAAGTSLWGPPRRTTEHSKTRASSE